MTRIVSTTRKVHDNGCVETVTEFEGGFSVIELSRKPADARPPAFSQRAPGYYGFRGAVRVIDAMVERGEITVSEAAQREEDLVTEYDRDGW